MTALYVRASTVTHTAMNMPRTIEPEWLDELPSGDPRAMRSRRDLRRINALMMNATHVVRELRRVFPGAPPRVIAEIGAGDGRFMLQVAGKLPPSWRAVATEAGAE